MEKQTVLHVGCGVSTLANIPKYFGAWKEIRLDISPQVRPDIVADITNMAAVASGSVDAVYSSNNLEHLYAHEVPLAIAEFRRVLKDDGFALITTPDLQAVAKVIAEGNLDEALYDSPSGPVAPIDVVFGFRPSLKRAPTMAHKTGFTQKSLAKALAKSFAIASCARGKEFDLWAIGLPVARSRDAAQAKLTEILSTGIARPPARSH